MELKLKKVEVEDDTKCNGCFFVYDFGCCNQGSVFDKFGDCKGIIFIEVKEDEI